MTVTRLNSVAALAVLRHRRRRARRVVMLVLAVSAVGALLGAAMPATVVARSGAIAGRGVTSPSSCTPSSAPRDPANPLMSATAPSSADPLAGASFFVDGPTHGAAAGEIARLLGIDSSTPTGNFLSAFPDDESWQQFLTTTVASRLPSEPAAIQYQVQMLEKIAVEPEAQRISVYAEGGSPAGLSKFTTKLLCDNLTADPGTVPIITTYLMHPVLGGCASTAQINAYMPCSSAGSTRSCRRQAASQSSTCSSSTPSARRRAWHDSTR